MANSTTQDITIWSENGAYSANVNSSGKLEVDASFTATSIKLENSSSVIINPATEDTLATVLTSVNSLITIMTTNIDGGFAGAVYGASDFIDGGGA